MEKILEKLKILADSAKFDVSCSSSGVGRKNRGTLGSAAAEGICHTWSADGRCVSLLKVLFSNRCAYDCAYCVNRRSADCRRASFLPEELAELTMEFYRRNYIEGLFLSSAVEVSPDYTAERILACLRLLRYKYGFAGYIHAKIIPGVSEELVHGIGLMADRLSVNIEMPTSAALSLFAPQKKPKEIFRPMRQITNSLIERNSLKGPGTMFQGREINSPDSYLTPGRKAFGGGGQIRENQNHYDAGSTGTAAPAGDTFVPARRKKGGESFAPAGQTTQMIIGAGDESDRQILYTAENLYRTFKMKRVYFSAYIPAVKSPILPDSFTAPPLGREHRLYQADWLLRFYGFSAGELLDDGNPDLDQDLDPKVSWALRHLDEFPVEVNKAPLDRLLRIPGVGAVSARRIVSQRKFSAVKYDELQKMGVVLKRAKYFLTCGGRFYGDGKFEPSAIRNHLLETGGEQQLSLFAPAGRKEISYEGKAGTVYLNG